MGEVPLLKRLAAKHEAEGLALLGVSVDSSARRLDLTVKEEAIPWPQLWDAKGYDAEVPRLYAMDGTPLLYLVDRGARLAGRFRSAADVESELPEALSTPAAVPRVPRDQWQRPNAIMDRLGVRAGSVVADVGAGEGYLARHLAARVEAAGKVYAVDIDEKALARLREAAGQHGIPQLEAVLGAPDDPRLPAAGIDVALT